MGYGSKIESSLFQTGMEKYRPIFQAFYAFLHSHFGDDLQKYLWVAKALIIALAFAIGFLLKSTTRLGVLAFPVAITYVSFMRFLWPATEWILGIMDLLALIFSILTIFFYIEAVKNSEKTYLIGLGNLFLTLAIFTHEKSLVISVASSIFFLIIHRYRISTVKISQILMPSIILITSYSIKIIVLDLNPFQGSQLNYENLTSQSAFSSAKSTITGGLLNLFGLSNYGATAGITSPLQTVLSCTLLVTFIAYCTCFFKQIRMRLKSIGGLDRSTGYLLLDVTVFYISVCGFGSFLIICLEPYAQERFLVLPQICLLAFLLHVSTNISPRNVYRTAATSLTLLLLIGIEASYIEQRTAYNPTQARIISLMSELRPFYEGSDAWQLQYSVPDDVPRDVPWEYNWAIGYPTDIYSGIFSITQNPPVLVYDPTRTSIIKCVKVSLEAKSLVAQVADCD